jgi:heme exporter protein C
VILDGIAGISVLLALFVALDQNPIQASQGHLLGMFYLYVSAVWVATLTLLVSLMAGVTYLSRGEERFDDLLRASMEIGLTFVPVAILTGCTCAKLAHDTWWVWNPYLVASAALWIVYLVHLALRRGFDDPHQRARYSAVYMIMASASGPFTFVAALWWQDSPSVIGQLGPSAMAPMLICAGAFTLLSLALVRHRLLLAEHSRQITYLRAQICVGEA